MSTPDDIVSEMQDEIDRLEDLVEALRQEVREQWEVNHHEHCSNEWPHAEGQRCHWPLPALVSPSDG